MMISVVIPAYREDELIGAAIASALAAGVEVIVADGGNDGRTALRAAGAGARVIPAPTGRAKQMNAGAAAAGGKILLFLHADTLLPGGWKDEVERTLGRKGVAGGAFRLGIDGGELSLRLIAAAANWRSRIFGMPYGDQALFMKASTFREVGGFPDIPFMEDFAMSRLLRRRGRIGIAAAVARTSPRRWREVGPWRLTLRNQAAVAAWFLGVSPRRIGDWYHRGGAR